ncbi:MAG: hypothetical protein Q8L20_06415 [Gammaproteobacteria bacterium]|nr:hypothetical protein [Gammaproteobacteria bacterium]
MKMNCFGKQNGAVLILMFVGLFMAGATVVLTALNNRNPQLRENARVQAAMQEAKQALLAYAVMYNNEFVGSGPGRLPCPDKNNSGESEEGVDCAGAAFGRLPQRHTLPFGALVEFGNLYAGIDQQFWYAVSANYRHPVVPTSPLNSSTPGTLTLDGDEVVAVIIAPGQALGTQSRIPANVNSSVHYLDSANSGGTNFVSLDAISPETFNDRLLPIRRRELMTLVTARVAQEIKRVLDPADPYPDVATFETAMAAAGGWYITDGWDARVIYTQDSPRAQVQFTDCNIVYVLTPGEPDLLRTNSTSC